MDEEDWEELALITFTIPLVPVTKKNHGQIIFRNGRAMVLPSKQYLQYLKDCKKILRPPAYCPISGQVNLKAVFYMPTRRRVDLVNLLQALCDILVDCGYIQDDNSKIIVSVDGSRVGYDKNNPRTEVMITEIEEDFKHE